MTKAQIDVLHISSMSICIEPGTAVTLLVCSARTPRLREPMHKVTNAMSFDAVGDAGEDVIAIGYFVCRRTQAALSEAPCGTRRHNRCQDGVERARLAQREEAHTSLVVISQSWCEYCNRVKACGPRAAHHA